MSITRREFIRNSAIAATATAAGVVVPGVQDALAQAQGDDGIKWDKGVCRYCGTGCGVLVGVRDGRVVATQGDPDAPVNKGLNCIKGYFLAKIMYGKDRLTSPMLRMKDGKYDKGGEFTPITWKQAFDVMEEKCKATLKAKGPTAVGMFGSGQWTVWEGYAANKLFKAGFRSNNVDPNARHCMASAVMGFMRTFGADEPMGCYDDAEHADAFVLWGSNMAEMHPILWSRITDRRLNAKHVKVVVLSTFWPPFERAGRRRVIFKPQTDLAIINYICNHIIQSGAVNEDFVSKHVTFRKGVTDIGYGLRPNHPLEQVANNNGYPGADGKPKGDPNASSPMSFDEFKAFVSTYTLDYTSQLSGVPKDKLEALAKTYADPKTKVTSYWTMGFNQHTRGTWVNNMIYNVHLLVGKITEPGNSPFSLTGQPSACGTAREVGTFAHRLPADLLIANPQHREIAERIWRCRRARSRRGRLPRRAAGPHAQGRRAQLLLDLDDQQHAGRAQPQPERYPGFRDPRNFIVVSDAYPTVTALSADLILPSAMWTEKEGAFGNAERRGQFWRQQVSAPGQVEVRPVAVHRVQQALQDRRGVAGRAAREGHPQYKGKTLYDVLYANGAVNEFPARPRPRASTRMPGPATPTTRPRPSASTCRRGCSRSTASSASARARTSASSTTTTACAACAGRSSTARRRCGATARATTPT